MKVEYGKGTTEYGPGVDIKLTGTEVAEAIDLWLHTTGNLTITGPMTITVNGQLCKYGLVYVDPSGSVITQDKTFYGRGEPSTRKYEQEYKLYCEYTNQITTLDHLDYNTWVLDWEQNNQVRQQTILLKYAEALGHSVKSVPIPSLQESSVVESAFCFAIDVKLGS